MVKNLNETILLLINYEFHTGKSVSVNYFSLDLTVQINNHIAHHP